MKNNRIHSETEICSDFIASSYDIENCPFQAENYTEIIGVCDQTITIPAETITEMVEVSNQPATSENEIITQLRTMIHFQNNRISTLRCINCSLTICFTILLYLILQNIHCFSDI